ncbi:AAA family ATPase [Salinibacterium amurskyense]|uniref:ATP-dependent nuclease n=1 Tax=Salinibacterium amurskyense TaxID=205941 RepID=UPI00311D3DDA
MYISKVSLVNYRNFRRSNVFLEPGVNTIIGENGSGKSNLFRAIRLLLDEALVTRKHDLSEGDFHRGLDNWRGHWLVVLLEFREVSDDESVQSLLLHHAAEESEGATERATYSLVFRPKSDVRDRFAALAVGDDVGLEKIRSEITIDDYERILFGKMSVDLTDEKEYTRVVGDFEAVKFSSDKFGHAISFDDEVGIRIQREMSLWREFSLSYVPALRNVVADFSDVRRNPLLTLLAAKSEQMPEGDFDEILDKVRQLNSDIEGRDDVQEITRGIHKTFKDTVGETYSPTSMQIQSELPLEAADLFKSLKLYVGENGDTDPRRLQDMSLGGANLVYLTLKLLEFEYRTARRAIANFLLIEEPEAHIHTHIQKTLFDRVSFKNTQIIYSTHSTHISEVSEIGRVNVLSREGSAWVALQPSADLKEPEIQAAQRFLDAVRSNLLFARSVLLVEGDAEEILIPGLMKKIYGISLDEIGISLINVRSTGFETLARLFDIHRLRKRCAILTDHDQTFFDATANAADGEKLEKLKKRARASAKAGAERQVRLEDFRSGNNYVHVSYAPHTFEVDFAAAGKANRMVLEATVDEVYDRASTRTAVKLALKEMNISTFGLAALRLANRAKKGWFALLVGRKLDAGNSLGGPMFPTYVLDAIGFVSPDLPDETWVRILEHRLAAWREDKSLPRAIRKTAEGIVERIKNDNLTISNALVELSALDYQDPRIVGLASAVGK